jgi:ribose transport system substrate-binding protein
MNHRILCVLTLGALALAGCVRETSAPGGSGGMTSNAPASPAPAAKKSDSDRLKVAVVPKGTTHQFWQTVKAGADAAGQEMNAEILWNGPKSETNIQDQIDIIKAYAGQGVDGVALAATDKEALVKTVQELEGQGIPVVTIDSGIEPDVSRSFIATDNVAAAGRAADEMARLVGEKGNVAVLSFLKGAGTSDQREQGFLEGIKAFPNIKVVGVEYTDSDSAKAADKMETFLTQHPDLVGVFASNEPNVVGAAGVLERKKLAGKVKLVGFDASESEIQYMEKGSVQALIVQDPFKMGYEGVKAIAQLVRGKGTPQKRIDTGAQVVTKENMTTPEIHKLLFPLEKPGAQASARR